MALPLARPPAPALTVERTATGTLVHYTVPPDAGAPAAAKIVASLAPKDPSSPPHTVTADLDGLLAALGVLTVPSFAIDLPGDLPAVPGAAHR